MSRLSSRRPKVVHQAPSPFGTVFVVDSGDERTLRFDSPEGNRQSAILKSDPRAIPLHYVRLAAAGLVFASGRSRALVVGLGGGSLPMLLCRLPHLLVDVVELNPVVVDVAQRFFGVQEHARLHIILEDGALFMQREAPLYDFIVLDAFSDAGIPSHLKEEAFFEDVQRRLAPGGAAVINIALGTSERKTQLIETFTRVFKKCARMHGTSGSTNIILVAAQVPFPSEPVFHQLLWRLSRELNLPELTGSVRSFERVALKKKQPP